MIPKTREKCQINDYKIECTKKRNPSVRVSFSLVQLEGFEPPTVRFVAEYSIQLSYSCINYVIII